MNKFITTDNGGLPIVLDDFRFIDDSVREAFFGIVTAWGVANEDSYILSGCEITLGVNISVAAGYVVIQGEVYKFNAQSITGSAPAGEEVTLVINTAFDSAGNKTFDTGGTFDTYQLRTAALQYNVIAATNFKLFAAKTINEKIAIGSAPYFGAWQTIILAANADVMQNDNTTGTGNDISLTTLPQSGDYLRYNIVGNVVNIVFYFQITTTTNTASAASSLIIKNLPFTFENINQNGLFIANSGISEAASGTHPVKMEAASNRLVFQLLSTQGNNLSFNRKYQLSTPPAKSLNPTADLLTSFGWIVSGSITGVIQ